MSSGAHDSDFGGLSHRYVSMMVSDGGESKCAKGAEPRPSRSPVLVSMSVNAKLPPAHYPMKDFETWLAYFQPSKLLIKALNIMLPAMPAWQHVLESHIQGIMLHQHMDHDDAEYELHSRLLEMDAKLWEAVLKETWDLSVRELTIVMLVTDFIKKSLDHNAKYTLDESTVDKLTKLVNLSYHRKVARYGTGYFNGERGRIMRSLFQTAQWSSRHQRVAMFAAEIMMATWPMVSSWHNAKKTLVTIKNRGRKGKLLGWTLRGVFFVVKKGVYHAVVWVCGAAGIAVIGAYWPLAKTSKVGDIGVLVGGLLGETFAGAICSLFDGFIEPTVAKDDEDYGVDGLEDPWWLDQYLSGGKPKKI